MYEAIININTLTVATKSASYHFYQTKSIYQGKDFFRYFDMLNVNEFHTQNNYEKFYLEANSSTWV